MAGAFVKTVRALKFLPDELSQTICNTDFVCVSMYNCRSFENNLKTYKLLAHRKPESELPHVSVMLCFTTILSLPLNHTTPLLTDTGVLTFFILLKVLCQPKENVS